LLALQESVLNSLKNTSQSLDLATLAAQVGAEDQIEAVYKIVRHLAANNRGIVLEGNLAVPSSLKVGKK